jgi:diadenosine tetraphosphatase ApaH/serine/threonine PP2A family protein phosphatase
MNLQSHNGSPHTSSSDISGAGYQFGAQIVEKFLHVNKMRHILRAHQLCNEGYQVLISH